MFNNANIQLLTIARNAEKCAKTVEHLKGRGIEPQLFYGFDHEVTGLRTTWTYELDHPGSGYIIGPKIVHMNLGHYMLWKVASYLPHDVTVIMEDDVRFEEDWREHFDCGIGHLPDDWDLLFLGSCCVAQRCDNQVIWGRLCRVKYALCTHAYAVRKKALPVFLEKGAKQWTNVDISMALEMMPSLNCFAFLPRLAHQLDTFIPP